MKFSEKIKKKENEVIENTIETPIEEPTERIFNPKPETVEETYIKEGIVTGCEKLNVRKNPSPNAEVLCILNKGDKVQIDLQGKGQPVPADVSFYQVITVAGVKGYCVTKFISIE